MERVQGSSECHDLVRSKHVDVGSYPDWVALYVAPDGLQPPVYITGHVEWIYHPPPQVAASHAIKTLR
jgi:hypothetical protein